jgi:hypothetical protein
VEFKLGAEVETGKRCPFAPGRQWHFLIFDLTNASCGESGGAERFVCISRDHVKPEWAEATNLSDVPASCKFQGVGGLEDMCRYIQSRAQLAIDHVNEMMQQPQHTGDTPPEELLSSNASEERFQEIEETVDQNSEEARARETNAKSDERYEAERLEHAKGLPWLCKGLNTEFARAGSLICFPVDPGHGLGDHTIAKWDWTAEQSKNFFENGDLPVYEFEEEAQDLDCVMLRFMDMSGGVSATPPLAAPYMREVYWTRPPCRQYYVLVGCMLDPEVMRRLPSVSSYLLMPAEFLSQFNQGFRDPVEGEGASEKERQHNRANVYFRDTKKKLDTLPQPKFAQGRSEAKAMERGGPFMADANVNPRRYVVDMASGVMHRTFSELLNGDGHMHIEHTQGDKPNASFEKKSYILKVRQVQQAAWEYSCKSPPRISSYSLC